jgi:serine/threonine protein kinase
LRITPITTQERDSGVPPEIWLITDDDSGPNSPCGGGNGIVYFSLDGQWAFKRLHFALPLPQNRVNEARQRLNEVRQRLHSSLNAAHENRFAIPVAFATEMDAKPCFGYVMRRIPGRYHKLQNLYQDISDLQKQISQGCTWADFVRVARSIATMLALLEDAKLAHTDLSASNILVDLASGESVLIDMDSCVHIGDAPLRDATPGYVPPEMLVAARTAVTSLAASRHSLAILLMHTLLFRNVMLPTCDYSDDSSAVTRHENLGYGDYALFSEDPDNGRHRPWNLGTPVFTRKARGPWQLNPDLMETRYVWPSPLSYRMLPPALQELADNVFIHGLWRPVKRNPAADWAVALTSTLDQLCICEACGQPTPFPYWQPPLSPGRLCHLCHTPFQQTPVVLRLFERAANTPYAYSLTQRTVVRSTHYSELYADMFCATPDLMATSTRQQIGVVEGETGNRLLRRLNGNAWKLYLPGNGFITEITENSSFPLTTGAILQYDDGPILALVSEA